MIDLCKSPYLLLLILINTGLELQILLQELDLFDKVLVISLGWDCELHLFSL